MASERSDSEGAVQASAHGRVNLMGDHTDYNDGFVLPMLIPQATVVSLRTRDDLQVNATSAAMRGAESYELGEERPRGSWIDYVQGVTVGLRMSGCRLSGFDLKIESTVPAGAGLSSSAALEIALLRALRKAFALELDDLQLAKLGRGSETEFLGVPIGIMDQLAVSLGRPGEALFIDTRSLATTAVAIPESVEVAVIDSGLSHDHSQSGYRTRRDECERAAAQLGLKSLRDLAPSYDRHVAELDETLRRRVRHVASETNRVLKLMAALERRDMVAMRSIFEDSHASLRDDYEVSTPEIDELVLLAEASPDVIGARLTGGGFGGSIVLLAHRGAGRRAAERVASDYASASRNVPTVLLPMREG